VLDGILEASVVGSFTRIGPALRGWSERWQDPPSARGRGIVVTGATSGLGLATARALARLGARVCLVGRDPARLDQARRALQAIASGEVIIERADFQDLGEVEALAERLAERLKRIDVLVHNAAVMMARHTLTPGGIEATVAVNLVSPYLLTERLLPVLADSTPARVITMTSGGMYTQRFSLDNLVMAKDHYDGVVAYARTKRAEVVITEEWQRRYGSLGIDFHVVHPGWVDTPGLSASLPRFATTLAPLLRKPSEGADTVIWLAGGPEGTHGGRLWLDRRPRSPYRLPWTWVAPGRRAAEGAELWDWCHNHVGGLRELQGQT
jgi:NAD(P)-dependent dehydrogenase (short-subunit alcohol dehydrogenase family)